MSVFDQGPCGSGWREGSAKHAAAKQRGLDELVAVARRDKDPVARSSPGRHAATVILSLKATSLSRERPRDVFLRRVDVNPVGWLATAHVAQSPRASKASRSLRR